VVDDGGADNVNASDSKDTMLVLTLDASGPHGWPSDEAIGYTVYKGAARHRDYVKANTTTEGNLRKLQVGFKDLI
jgi:hypothetical protein